MNTMTGLGYECLYSITNIVMQSARKALLEEGFTEILPSILSSQREPGAMHSVAVMGHRKLAKTDENADPRSEEDRVVAYGFRYYYLSVSMAMEKQYALKHNDAVFCFAPCLRLLQDGEKNSRRHLYTFTQIEVEKKNASADEMRRVHEKVCKGVAHELLVSPLAAHIDIRNVEALLHTPYHTYSFPDAKNAASESVDDDSPRDLSLEEETKFAASHNVPVWIRDYPLRVRDSLYHEYLPGVLETFDLILPFGFGEVTTGGQRVVSGEEAESQAKILDSQINSELEMYIAFKKRLIAQKCG